MWEGLLCTKGDDSRSTDSKHKMYSVQQLFGPDGRYAVVRKGVDYSRALDVCPAEVVGCALREVVA